MTDGSDRSQFDDIETPPWLAKTTGASSRPGANDLPFPFGPTAKSKSNASSPGSETIQPKQTSEPPSLVSNLPFGVTAAPAATQPGAVAGGAHQSLPRSVSASPPFVPRVSLIPAELAIPSHTRAARERHRMVVMLDCAGSTVPEICQMTGYKPAAVGIILRSKNPELIKIRLEFGSKVAEAITASVSERLQMYALASVDRLYQHMQDGDIASKGNSRQAAVAILDRAGFSPVKKSLVIGGTLPAEELKTLVGQLSKMDEVSSRKAEWAIATVGV